VEAAVRDAETWTGLQFSVYLGPVEDDARGHAERLFLDAGGLARPSVLILVAPSARKVEIVTAPSIRARVPDRVCAQVVEAMTGRFADGDMERGIVDALRDLAAAAGPGTAPVGAEELPDVLGSEDIDS
jgi:uncharacterized membrane protein